MAQISGDYEHHCQSKLVRGFLEIETTAFSRYSEVEFNNEREFPALATQKIGPLVINPLSDNVGSVNRIVGVLRPALREERGFTLDEECCSNQGSLVIHAGQETRSDPSISSVSYCDHDY